MKYNYNKKGGYKSPAWTRKEGKSPTGGLNAKGRASAKAEGSNLKSQLSSGTSPRRVSFAARFAGMKGPMKKPNGEPTRKALALKKWGFGSVEAARSFANNNKKAQMGGMYSGGNLPNTMPQSYGAVQSYGPQTINAEEQQTLEAQQAELASQGAQQNITDQANLVGEQSSQQTGAVTSAISSAGDLLGKTQTTAAGIGGLAAGALGAVSDDGDATKLNVGEGLSAIGKGAAAGSMFGPVGTVAGAAIGGIGALVGRGKARREAAELKAENEDKQNRIQSKLSQADAEDLTYSGSDFGNPMGTVQSKYGGIKYQTGGDPLQNALNRTEDPVKGGSGTITQGPSFMERMKSGAKKMYNEYAPALVKDAPAIANYAKENPLDAAQVGLGALAVGADSIPVVGNAVSAGADLVNAGISGGRSAYYANKGDTGKASFYAGLGAMDLAAIAPGAGNVAGLGKMGKLIKGAADSNRVAKTAHAAHIANKGVTALKTADVASQGNLLSGISTKAKPDLVGQPLVQKGQMGGAKKLPGGVAKPIPGSDAVEFKGQTHAEGGIMMDPQTEVEDKETMDKVTMKGGDKRDYFFSSYLKHGGMSYADAHKQILKKGGGQKEIDMLAKMQEYKAGRNPDSVKMQNGGYADEVMANYENNFNDANNNTKSNFFNSAKETFNDKVGALKDKISDYKEGAADRQKERALRQMYKDTPDIALAAGAAQMIPAMYAFNHKEKAVNKLNYASDMVAPDLDRVNFNAERSSNEASNRAVNRFIETSGGGPANIAAKMAAYSKKQDQDMKIVAAEQRANVGISNQEAQMRMTAQARNIANRMNVDSKNVSAMEAQRLREENNKKEAIDVAMKNVAGLASDVMQYQADGDYSRAIGNMGIAERQKLRSSLKGTINKDTGEAWTDAEISNLFNEATKE
tara:strand:+ start:11121 stop:13868 length:2748 start_codon:yes stop_codon:yes gene_type:complete